MYPTYTFCIMDLNSTMNYSDCSPKNEISAITHHCQLHTQKNGTVEQKIQTVNSCEKPDIQNQMHY